MKIVVDTNIAMPSLASGECELSLGVSPRFTCIRLQILVVGRTGLQIPFSKYK